ncbi:hypothetical protein DNTS_020649 [Danionella cerebrum]|uniref:Uncharacterized protein n=1 Tax=Danionella cerebrum TaxID=2873325 RepID=A0A553PZM9_9TELE|nr:hypothetical protein DNTS_020649 [Danionella translucida]TRY83132.1 hypothetical protein DNTS_020649 [Danionella translucida]
MGAEENVLVYGEEPFEPEVPCLDRIEDEMENPIYGNICLEGGGAFEMSPEVCYEQMSQASTMNLGLKVEEGDVAYASLDLTANKKRRKKRKYHKQAQTHQAQMHNSQAASQQNIQEQDEETKVALPSRNSSLMVSRHSIYLNSHQVVQETEERGREREQKTERRRDEEDPERELHKTLLENFDHSLGRSRQSLEQDTLQFES